MPVVAQKVIASEGTVASAISQFDARPGAAKYYSRPQAQEAAAMPCRAAATGFMLTVFGRNEASLKK